MTKPKAKTIEEVDREACDATLEDAINALNRLDKMRGHRDPRQNLFGGIQGSVSGSYQQSMKAAMGNNEIPLRERAVMNRYAAITNLYIAAVMQLASDPNTQWDDYDVLFEQLKHQMRRAMRSATCIHTEVKK